MPRLRRKQLPWATKARIFERDKNRCWYCRMVIHDLRVRTVDHFLPVSVGGNDSGDNLVTACDRCNTKKGNALPHELRGLFYREIDPPGGRLTNKSLGKLLRQMKMRPGDEYRLWRTISQRPWSDDFELELGEAMLSFGRGPANGLTLHLARAPVMLRVVKNRVTGKWDGLDQLGDVPRDDEDVFVYVMKPGSFVSGFIDFSDRKTGRRRGERFVSATYFFFDGEHPGDDVLRDNAAWAEWSMANLPEWAKAAAEKAGRING